MIKILLKHAIYEMCIDTFFTQIYKNFVLPKIIENIGDIKVYRDCNSASLIEKWSPMLELTEDEVRESIATRLENQEILTTTGYYGKTVRDAGVI